MRPGDDAAVVRPSSGKGGDGLSRRSVVAAGASAAVAIACSPRREARAAETHAEAVIVGIGRAALYAAEAIAAKGAGLRIYSLGDEPGSAAVASSQAIWLGHLPQAAARRRSATHDLEVVRELRSVRPSGSGYLLELGAADGATVFVRADIVGIALPRAALRTIRFDVDLPRALRRDMAGSGHA